MMTKDVPHPKSSEKTASSALEPLIDWVDRELVDAGDIADLLQPALGLSLNTLHDHN